MIWPLCGIVYEGHGEFLAACLHLYGYVLRCEITEDGDLLDLETGVVILEKIQ